MRICALPGRLALYAVCGGVMLGVAGPPAAVAQSRRAAIAVVASVRGAADADVIGAHAVAATERRAESGVRAAPEAGAWRITSGRGGQVGLQLETVETVRGDSAVYVTICDDADPGPVACRRQRAPHLAVSADGAPSDFVVRVGPSPSLRLTVAFISF
jgi:hypothetical protein